MATAAPVSGVLAWTACATPPRAPGSDRILITAPEGLARNYVHQMLLVEELQKHGAVVAFLDQPITARTRTTSCCCKMHMCRCRIRADADHRTHAPRPSVQAAGRRPAALDLAALRVPGGHPERPRDPAGVRLDEAEAAVSHDLFAWFDAGASVCELARRLRGLGIVSPSGLSSWHLSTVRGLLTNPVYTGQVFGNRLRTRPVERRRSALRPVGHGGESRRVNDPAEWIAVATVSAIIDREQFERVQERLAYTQRMARRNNRVHDYLLRGLVSCGHCRRAAQAGTCRRGYD